MLQSLTALAVLLATSPAVAQGTEMGNLAAERPRLEAQSAIAVRGAAFALSVADLEKTANWYRDTLGLEIVMNVPKSGTVPAVIVLEGDGLIVELIQNASPTAPRAPSGGAEGSPRLYKAGVIVQDFDGVVARLKGRGVKFVAGPFPARSGGRANLVISDIEGNLIQFVGSDK